MPRRAIGGDSRGRDTAAPAAAIVCALLLIPRALGAATPPGHLESPPDPGGAAETPGAVLLSDPGRLAVWLRDRNGDVLAAAARVRQAEAEAKQSRLHPNPEASGSLSDLATGRTNPPGLGYADTAILSGTLSETLEIGKRGPRIRSADLRLESERQAYLDTLGGKVAETRASLARIAYLKARRSVLEDSLQAARQIQDLQRSRMENGDLSGNDYDRLLVDTLLLDSEVARTRAEYDEATAVCGALLAAPCPIPDLDLATLGEAASLPGTPDVPAALETRPDLRSLEFDRRSAEEDAVLAHRRRIPDPNLSVGYTHDNLTISGDQPNTLLFSIGIPLPVFDHGQHEGRKAEEHARELGGTLGAARARARSEIEALLQRKAFLETTLASLTADAVPKSKGVLEATVAAVGQGGMSMTDLLLARRTHTDLMLKVMDLQFDAFSVRNDLRRALGLDADAARQVVGG
jgi:cobalt-zinc-cadmium efflux system outer membrane protein